MITHCCDMTTAGLIQLMEEQQFDTLIVSLYQFLCT